MSSTSRTHSDKRGNAVQRQADAGIGVLGVGLVTSEKYRSTILYRRERICASVTILSIYWHTFCSTNRSDWRGELESYDISGTILA